MSSKKKGKKKFSPKTIKRISTKILENSSRAIEYKENCCYLCFDSSGTPIFCGSYAGSREKFHHRSILPITLSG